MIKVIMVGLLLLGVQVFGLIVAFTHMDNILLSSVAMLLTLSCNMVSIHLVKSYERYIEAEE